MSGAPVPRAGAPVLVVGPAWVGDMVMAQVLFARLAAERPGVAVDVLAPGWSLPILERMPGVRAGLEMPLGHGRLALGVRWRLGQSLAGTGYGQVIVLPGSWKSALVGLAAGIPVRTGFRGEMRYGLLNDLRALDKRRLPTTVSRFHALGGPPGEAPAAVLPAPVLRTDAAAGRALAARLGVAPGAPFVALVPGAEYGPAKRWPAAHFARLARWLATSGTASVVFGSAKERALGQEIADAAAGAAINACGETRLAELADAFAAATAVVCNDSGAMHIAAASGARVVALYGSSSPAFTPPLSPTARVERLELPCSPCFARVCPLGHTACLQALAPERAWRHLAPPASAAAPAGLPGRWPAGDD